MSTVDRALERVFEGGEILGPVPDDAICRAEAELGVVFPDEYREFLGIFGAAVGNGIEIYGLPPNDPDAAPTWQSVVTVTRRLREQRQAGTENQQHIAISDDGMGTYFFLDTAASPRTRIRAIGPYGDADAATSLLELVDRSKRPS